MTRIVRFFIATWIVAAAAAMSPSHGQSPEAKQRLESLSAATSLDHDGRHPWHLRVAFDIYDLEGRKKESGTAEEWWSSDSARKIVIRSPSYNFPAPEDHPGGDQPSRENYLIHHLLSEVVHPVPNFGSFEGLHVGVLSHAFGSSKLDCLQVSRVAGATPTFGTPTSAVCTEPASNLLRILFDPVSETVRNKPGRFLGTEVALDHSIAYNGRAAIIGHVDVLEAWNPPAVSVDSSSWSPQQPVQIPATVTGGKVLSAVAPEFPLDARANHLSGNVVLWVTISKEGKVSQIGVVASPSVSLTGAAMRAVQQWMFVPLMLKGQPAEVQTTISIRF